MLGPGRTTQSRTLLWTPLRPHVWLAARPPLSCRSRPGLWSDPSLYPSLVHRLSALPLSPVHLKFTAVSGES